MLLDTLELFLRVFAVTLGAVSALLLVIGIVMLVARAGGEPIEPTAPKHSAEGER